MPFTRREILKTGAAGVAVLTLVGCARRATGAGLDATQEQVVAKIAGVMLDGAIPSDEPGRSRALAEAVNGFAVAVAGLPTHTQGEVQQLFTLLTFPPARRLIAGLPPWAEATPDDVAAFLSRWRFSGILLLRSGYDALHQLVMAGWYGNNASWAAIGYPGPPEIV